MNVFVLHEDPVRAARMACDRHAVKMPTETAQLMSTAWHSTAGKLKVPEGITKASHANVPLGKWVRECTGNYIWLRAHFHAQLDEFEFRYGHPHAYASDMRERLLPCPPALPLAPRTPFVQAMPDRYKGDDAIHAYRLFYCGEKLHFARWNKGRPMPYWIDEYLTLLDLLPPENDSATVGR